MSPSDRRPLSTLLSGVSRVYFLFAQALIAAPER